MSQEGFEVLARIKIAVVGSRRFPKPDMVREFVRSLPRDFEVISGGAEGVDTWAVEEAEILKMDRHVFYPDKTRHKGYQALFQRNREIAYDADAGVGFWYKSSGGTLDTAKCFQALNKPFKLVCEDDELPTVEELLALLT